MNKLKQIEQSVADLDMADFEAFTAWFEALQAERWDRKFERDAQGPNAALDGLAEVALDDFRNGRTNRL